MDSQFPLQELPPKIFINDDEYIDNNDEYIDNDDIVRGDRESALQTEQGSAASLKSFSTASSGSFRLAGGRLGTLATRLERAIARWARKNWADSSSSLTSSDTTETSRSSFPTTNKSKKSSRRKRRPPSLADIQRREQSLRAVEARIRARGIGRIVPREFNLYSPSSSSEDAGLIEEEQEQRSIRTFSLDVMLPHLEHVRRKPGKPRRPRGRSRTSPNEPDHPCHPRHLDPPRGHSTEFEPRNATRTNAPEDPLLKGRVEKGKGKDKISSTIPPPNPPQTASTSQRDPVEGKPPQAWWLDVASPTWEDMKALGKASGFPFLPLSVN
jgi:magnesium transporter